MALSKDALLKIESTEVHLKTMGDSVFLKPLTVSAMERAMLGKLFVSDTIAESVVDENGKCTLKPSEAKKIAIQVGKELVDEINKLNDLDEADITDDDEGND